METKQNIFIPSSTVGTDRNETKLRAGTSQKTGNSSGQNIYNNLAPKQSGAITPLAARETKI
jgi:hypothetical protein